MPTITLEGDANGAPHPDPSAYAAKFSGAYSHRTIEGGIGHNLPQEAPKRSPMPSSTVGGTGHEPVRHAKSGLAPSERGPSARLRRGDRLAQLGAARARRICGEGRPRRLLDVHVHQLAAHARLRPCMGREVREPGAGRRRRPHARVPVREGDRQRPRGREGHERRVSDRARPRLRGLGRRSATATGRPRTSPTRKDGSATTSSARADTTSASESSSSCCAKRERTASARTWSPYPATASRLRPTGRTSSLPRPTSATSKATTSHRPAASRSTSHAPTPCRSG